MSGLYDLYYKDMEKAMGPLGGGDERMNIAAKSSSQGRPVVDNKMLGVPMSIEAARDAQEDFIAA
jgi:hypothetical protein